MKKTPVSKLMAGAWQAHASLPQPFVISCTLQDTDSHNSNNYFDHIPFIPVIFVL